MWAALAILIIIISTVGYLYLKATFLKSFMMLMSAILACIITFTYFEKLADLLLSRGYGGQWAHPIVFILLFLLTLAILTAITNKLIVQNIIIGDRLDLGGRVFFSVLLGFILSGIILIAVAMMPIPTEWPYERFENASETATIDPDAPKKVLLNPDGFVAGLYSWVSQGSLSSKKSFAVFHADYINQLHLNRNKPADSKILSITGTDSLKVKAAWEPLNELKDSADSKPLPIQSPTTRPVIVRAAIKSGEIKEGGVMDEDGIASFTLAQIRLMCKPNNQAQDLKGSAEVVFPVGYIETANQVKSLSLTEEIVLERSEFSGGLRWFDFVFNVPSAAVPILLEFKQNAVAAVPPLAIGDKIPEQL